MINNIELYKNNIKKALNEKEYQRLKNQSVLITGANGMIGSAVVDVLNYLNESFNYNIKIYILVRNKNKILERFKTYENIYIVEQDVINKISLDEEIDYIIHAASNAHPKMYAEDPVGTMLGNFIGMNNIMEFAINHKCKKVEYISSGEVYGQAGKDVVAFDEQYMGKVDSTSPRSCYPLSKLASETLCASYSKQYNIETVIARPCHIYGPTQTESDSRVSAQFLNNILENKDIVMKSEGLQTRSYCYVVDCATAILTILLYGQDSNAYNISNMDSILTIREMAEKMAKKNNKKVIFELPTEKEKSGYTPFTRAVLDNKKLQGLGWKAHWNFDDGIEQTLNIMKK